MKKLKLTVAALTLLLWSCGELKEKEEGREVAIHGKVNFPQIGYIVITEMRQMQSSEGALKDTIQLDDQNKFEWKTRIRQPGYYQIDFFGMQVISLILDSADLTLEVDGNSQGGMATIVGSPDLDLIKQVQSIIQRGQQSDEARALEGEFQIAVQKNDQAKVEELQKKYAALMDKSFNEAAEIMKAAPLSLGLIHLLHSSGMFDQEKYQQLYFDMADKFKREWPDIQNSKDFVAYVDKMRVTAVGQQAPEISLPDPNGNILTLSSFRGKYILVDFWAKWCGPCRRENPNVVKAYHAFKDKNFSILGVSLDRSKADWLQAIQEDGLVWNHVSDLKYFESQAALDYNISGIPFSILVDPSGMIIAKNLRGKELHDKLAEVLK